MSDINIGGINQNFPVAGQDNSSQGFRDNFANIKLAFTTATNEITALQTNRARLDAPNDFGFAGAQSRVKLQYSGYVAQNSSAITGSLDYTLGSYHKSAITSTTTFQVTKTTWPTTGIYSQLRLEVAPTSAGVDINFSADAGTLINDSNLSLPYKTLTTNSTVWDLWTSDGGTTVFVKPVIIPDVTTKFISTRPATSVGSAGDKQGMMYVSNTATYICYADYVNTTTNIWNKIDTVATWP